MNEKLKSCFAAHIYMHSLFGLGLGILAGALFPQLRLWWLGVGAMVVAVVWDTLRKA